MGTKGEGGERSRRRRENVQMPSAFNLYFRLRLVYVKTFLTTSSLSSGQSSKTDMLSATLLSILYLLIYSVGNFNACLLNNDRSSIYVSVMENAAPGFNIIITFCFFFYFFCFYQQGSVY